MEAVLTYRSNWWGYISKRFLIAVIAFFIISLMIFFFIHLTVDEYYLVYGSGFIYWSPEATENFQTIWELASEEFHLNEPLIFQYFRYMGGFFTGDWGNSLIHTID
jgi:ABC-type dipeptide/oligopeptide/nickel transport system permease component